MIFSFDKMNVTNGFPCRINEISCESPRLLVELHRSLPNHRRISLGSSFKRPWKNFFQTILPHVASDQRENLRFSIIKMIQIENFNQHFISTMNFLKERYPKTSIINEKANRVLSKKQNRTTERNNSKANIHQILNLFDPDLRPKMMPPKRIETKISTEINPTIIKGPMSFKRLGARITTIAAFSRANNEKKHS